MPCVIVIPQCPASSLIHNVQLTNFGTDAYLVEEVEDTRHEVADRLCTDTCIDMCRDMCIDTCRDMCIDMCIDMYTGMCRDICIGMYMDMYIHMHTQTCV